jgi:hypothetical protein
VALLGGEAAATFFIEFRDELKATHNYLSSIGGKYSQAKISDQNRAAGLNKEAIAIVFPNKIMRQQPNH